MRDARSVALDVLVRVENGAYAHVLLPARLRASGLDARDRAFVTDLVYGTVREQRRLDALLAPVSHQPLDRLEPRVRAALRIGAYQLLHDVPEHAAVSESVRVAPARARGLVNAVLRSVAAAGPAFPVPADLGTRYSYPDWIVAELEAALAPEDLEAVLASGNAPAAMTLRPNPKATSAAALLEELRAARIGAELGRLVPDAVVVRGGGDPSTLPAIVEGRATPQDQASQAVAAIVDVHDGDRVLDIAAAPGGKATALAERLDRGVVVAVDLHAARLQMIRAAARRLRLARVVLVRADGRRLPVPDAAFDRVLLDAPCSGLGVLRRRPEARWHVVPEAVEELAALQRRLLAEAARTVRPGGRLVYAVCTLTRAETRRTAAWALTHLIGFEPEPPPPPPWEPWGAGAVLLPHRAGTDGMFVLALRRASSSGG